MNEDNEVSIITETFEPTVLNRIDMKEEWIERVQQGFWRVTHNGTARSYFAGESYNPAGKTGTAQSVKNGKIQRTLHLLAMRRMRIRKSPLPYCTESYYEADQHHLQVPTKLLNAFSGHTLS